MCRVSSSYVFRWSFVFSASGVAVPVGFFFFCSFPFPLFVFVDYPWASANHVTETAGRRVVVTPRPLSPAAVTTLFTASRNGRVRGLPENSRFPKKPIAQVKHTCRENRYFRRKIRLYTNTARFLTKEVFTEILYINYCTKIEHRDWFLMKK